MTSTTAATAAAASATTPLQNYLASQTKAKATDAANAASSTSANSTSNALQSATGNFNTFLKILTTQLQNQDPTNATNTDQFTQELVQFSQVEQQLNTNNKLDTLVTQGKSGVAQAQLDYINKFVELSSAASAGQLVVQNGAASLGYNLTDTPQSVSIKITDSKGNTVATLAGSANNGINRISWNGQLADGTTAPDGTYKAVVTETKTDNSTAAVADVRLIGAVTSVSIDPTNGNKLVIGGVTANDSDVDTVFDGTATKTTSSTGA